MHQLTHRTNLLLACLTAIATAAALRLPWFAAATPPSDPDGGARRVLRLIQLAIEVGLTEAVE